MSVRFCLVALALAAGTIVPRGDVPVAAASPGEVQDATTLDDQVDLAVTVYNSDLALIRDVRTLTLGRGISELRFMDIAATVNPATVHFRSLSEPSRVSVLEQNYEYDLLDPEKLLRKYIGRDVTLVQIRQEGGSTREEEVKARLLSFNSAPVWQIGTEIVTGLRADHVRFPEVPASLFSRPTLIWTLENGGGTSHRVEASYLAGKLSWNADYVLTVARDDKSGDVDGWVTLTNGSGTEFRNARLQLVAGDLNRVRQVVGRMMADEARAELAAAPKAMSQEAFSDYHLYTLDRKTTVGNNETKQVKMLGGTGFPVEKRYIVDGQAFYYRNAQHPGAPLKDVVQVYYQFKNEERAGLGIPMPAGVVRVYQSDSKGGLQFVGEDRIDHTPKDETLNLKIGNAFDVVAERKQIDFEKIAANVFEVEYEITLRNHKPSPIAVEVNEPIGGTWRILRSTHEWVKTDAWAAQFKVPVAADGSSVLTYRVRVTYLTSGCCSRYPGPSTLKPSRSAASPWCRSSVTNVRLAGRSSAATSAAASCMASAARRGCVSTRRSAWRRTISTAVTSVQCSHSAMTSRRAAASWLAAFGSARRRRASAERSSTRVSIHTITPSAAATLVPGFEPTRHFSKPVTRRITVRAGCGRETAIRAER